MPQMKPLLPLVLWAPSLRPLPQPVPNDGSGPHEPLQRLPTMLDSTIYLLLTTLSLGLLHEHPSLNSEELFTTASVTLLRALKARRWRRGFDY